MIKCCDLTSLLSIRRLTTKKLKGFRAKGFLYTPLLTYVCICKGSGVQQFSQRLIAFHDNVSEIIIDRILKKWFEEKKKRMSDMNLCM